MFVAKNYKVYSVELAFFSMKTTLALTRGTKLGKQNYGKFFKKHFSDF